MKKVLFSIAIAAMATFTFTSCDSSNAGSNDNNVEQQDSATAEEVEIPIKDLKELVCEKYVLTVPEGFKANSRMVNYSCNIGLQEAPFVTAAVNYKDVIDFQKEVERDYKAIDDITAGDKTYQAYYWLDAENNNCHHVKAATPHGEGMVTVHFFTGASQMDKDAAKEELMKAVQNVLNNIALK